jgi:hypothetical protein
MLRLTPISPGVVHSSPYRTRLKSSKWSAAREADVAMVKDALERVPGVLDVRAIASGLVIEHEARPDIVENIGAALAEVSPVLLEHLNEDPDASRKEHKKTHAHDRTMAEKLLDKLNFDANTFNFSLPALSNLKAADAAPLAKEAAKKAVPAVLAGAGIMLLMEGQSILAGVGPLALFYWAFDYNWKMNQDKAIGNVAEEVSEVAVELHHDHG